MEHIAKTSFDLRIFLKHSLLEKIF